ncbi:magnesium and cobalt transport protein CorA [Nitrincola tibetensis]|uniref:Magnesium transport protein CorA n=1 Tax=Nitrincola tibetensis TaxID=2219697 RepID=A0A364NI98_9GAMM|nr:magnesium/cobalt transporter CorA [Nitrincola tibetensis]RAU16751.1 magnesium and cobalt transport protein CorA [Nitrincola tibetensis]
MIRSYTLENERLVEQASKTDAEVDLKQASWIDLHDSSDDERSLVDQLHPNSLPEADEVEEIEASARYFLEGQDLHVHSLFLYQSEGRHKTATVAFTLKPDVLLSVRDVDLADFRLLRLRSRRGWVEAASPLHIMTAIFQLKVDNLADQLEDLLGQLDDVSSHILENRDEELGSQMDKLAKLEDSNGKIRLCLMDTQRSVSFLLRNIRQNEEAQGECRQILRDLDTLMAHAAFIFEKIDFLMNTSQGFINIQQAKIIKIFSIAAVVFLPPTMIASIYGMNYEFMPELAWTYGYPFALGMMFLSGITPYLFFRYKGWL